MFKKLVRILFCLSFYHCAANTVSFLFLSHISVHDFCCCTQALVNQNRRQFNTGSAASDANSSPGIELCEQNVRHAGHTMMSFRFLLGAFIYDTGEHARSRPTVHIGMDRAGVVMNFPDQNAVTKA